ncbi:MULTISPECIES: DUF2147 domain-containing protein [unclassified Beijerinckia]|uniref:DUF2147 domain-containing protein n=1 Tax=unclassified Beijerinckia TaxID=2638183 RepID=UPI00089AAD33|nr:MULTISPECIES: DUF2147 domain-containing protein [unclassified Beijerinckia]MDH7795372.1 uncharacterized protein (DUF2147 family) [Beijerinckia sp. GAS462]SEB98784.1 Uncharacterized conserved protein, DUF2147 family [Beijerinckia sp. 28-YEA-48]
MHKIVVLAVPAAMFLSLSAPLALAQDASGSWARGDGIARVNIAPCGAQICAVNTWIKDGVTDEKIGDRLVMNVKPASPSVLSGTAYDPQRKMSYNIDITVAANSLKTQGCVLGRLLCKNMSWSRIR